MKINPQLQQPLIRIAKLVW